jgi:hypothetical protein
VNCLLLGLCRKFSFATNVDVGKDSSQKLTDVPGAERKGLLITSWCKAMASLVDGSVSRWTNARALLAGPRAWRGAIRCGRDWAASPSPRRVPASPVTAPRHMPVPRRRQACRWGGSSRPRPPSPRAAREKPGGRPRRAASNRAAPHPPPACASAGRVSRGGVPVNGSETFCYSPLARSPICCLIANTLLNFPGAGSKNPLIVCNVSPDGTP